MASFLSTLFGLGRVPDELRAELESEGIALLDEGLSQVTHYHEIPFDRLDGRNLEFGVKGENKVWLSFQAGDFQDDRSGKVTCTFKTDRAREFELRIGDIVAAAA